METQSKNVRKTFGQKILPWIAGTILSAVALSWAYVTIPILYKMPKVNRICSYADLYDKKEGLSIADARNLVNKISQTSELYPDCRELDIRISPELNEEMSLDKINAEAINRAFFKLSSYELRRVTGLYYNPNKTNDLLIHVARADGRTGISVADFKDLENKFFETDPRHEFAKSYTGGRLQPYIGNPAIKMRGIISWDDPNDKKLSPTQIKSLSEVLNNTPPEELDKVIDSYRQEKDN